MLSGGRRAMVLLAMVTIGGGLAACRDDEQGRPLIKEKGVYEGQADEELDQERLQELKSRAAGQKF